MHERRSLVAFAALLAIAALSVGAGALPGGTDVAHDAATSQQDGEAAPSGLVVRAIVGVLVVGLLLAVLFASGRRTRRSGDGSATGTVGRRTAVDVVAIAVLVLLLVVLAVGPALPEQLPNGPSPGDAGPGETVPAGPDRVWLAVATVVVLGVVSALRYRLRSGRKRDEADANRASGDDDAAALGRAAGRAADTLDAADDNGVYVAWQEMTALLDVDDPETTTPREFAARATAAGLARDDVEELTRLFETVRYGDRQATAGRERRAQEVFRRIETTYAGGGNATGPDATSGDAAGGS